MEAGIDVDFPIGFRAIAGLDSIIQAAGRVNREKKVPCSQVLVFDPDSVFIKSIPKYIEQSAAIARSILREYSSDPVSIQAINAFFTRLYSLQDERHAFDVKRIMACFEKNEGFDFKTAAEKFNLIENTTTTIIIPFNENAIGFIEELRYTPYPRVTLRKLQIYIANIYDQEFQALNNKGAIEIIADKYPVLRNMDFYHPETGLIIPENSGGDAIFY